MTQNQIKIVSDWANGYIEQLKTNLDKAGSKATGKTANSVRFEIKENGNNLVVEIFGRKYFATVETGRKPTPDKKPSREMIENIKEWTSAKGLPESAVWGIATNINKFGTKLWQQGGRKDIYTDMTGSMIDSLSESLGMSILNQTLDQIIKDGN